MAPDAPIAGLRRRIERLETAGASASSFLATAGGGGAQRSPLSFGQADLDAHFTAGGLGWGSHQIAGLGGDPVAARAFGFMLLARHLATRPSVRALVVQETSALRETGSAYGPGLHAFGLDPGRLVFIQAPDGAQALKAAHEALRLHACDMVVADLWAGAALADLSITRRFNLAAARVQALILLITPDLSATSAALTRWRVASSPSVGIKRRLGPPTFSLDLVRNRHGRTGRWILQWNSHDHAFQSVPIAETGRSAAPAPAALASSMGAAPVDRSRSARAPSAILSPGAYRQTG